MTTCSHFFERLRALSIDVRSTKGMPKIKNLAQGVAVSICHNLKDLNSVKRVALTMNWKSNLKQNPSF